MISYVIYPLYPPSVEGGGGQAHYVKQTLLLLLEINVLACFGSHNLKKT